MIEKINIDAPIEGVGLDSQNNMDVPKNVYGTGWYEFGPKPGEIGSAVIDGHFDTPTGTPAVFYDLKQLSSGDLIRVFDENGKEIDFTVERVQKFDVNQFPIKEIFARSDKSRLNLITCAGYYNHQTQNYSERIVVLATKK